MKKTKVTNPLLRPGNIDVDRIVGSHEYLLYKRVYIMDHIIDRPDLGFIPKMLMLDSINHDPIKILIYSPGGSVDAGFAMCDVMGMMKSPIITVGIGLQSMATTVFMMGSPGKRFLFPHARVMLHLPYGMMRGDEKDMAIASKQMTIIKNEIIDMQIGRFYADCGRPEELRKRLDLYSANENIDHERLFGYGQKRENISFWKWRTKV